MATIILLASSSKLTNPGEDKHGSMVFFDFLGFFMVAYPTRMATILNWTTALYVYMAFVKRVLRDGVAGKIYSPSFDPQQNATAIVSICRKSAIFMPLCSISD